MQDEPRREETIFNAALELPTPAARDAFLVEACGEDTALRRRVEVLLLAHAQADGCLDHPPCPAPSAGPTLPVLLAEKSSELIGHYKLLEPIGEGGFGTVWMAEQQEPVRRRVALKIIKPGMDTRSVIARFEAERQALALMDHPNIARVFDGGATATGRPYFVMELVRGVPITEYCDAHKLTTTDRLELFIQICHAVQHAHQKGVIHRDLKPSNVLVTVQDDQPVAKVIDFGIAKATDARLTEKTLFTQFRQFIGTPAYMSPEQAGLGGLDIDTRSDIYSLGVLLYELLTGRPPFDATQLLEASYEVVLRTIREQDPPKPSTRLSTLDAAELTTIAANRRAEPQKLGRLVRGDLDWIVMKALEKERQRRYETANALAQDIERYLANRPVEASPPSVTYRVRRFVQRNRLLVGSAAAIGLTLVVATMVSLYLAAVATAQRDKATRAQRAEFIARQDADQNAGQSRTRLVRLDVANGVRALTDGDWSGALLWFAEAWSQDPTNQSTAAMHQLRVGATLSQLPKLTRMQFHNGPVEQASISPDGRLIVTAAGDRAQIWETATGQAVASLPHTVSWIAPKFSADGQRLLTFSNATTAVVSDVFTGQPIAPPMAHQFAVANAILSSNGRRMFTTCYRSADAAADEAADRSIHFWNVATGQPVRPPLPWREHIRQLTISPDDRWLGVIGLFGSAAVWDLHAPGAWLFDDQSASEATRLPAAVGAPAREPVPAEALLPGLPPDGAHPQFARERLEASSMTFDSRGRWVLFACTDGAARLWSLSSGQRVREFFHATGRRDEPSTRLRMAAFSPDGDRILTVGHDGTVRFGDTQTGRSLGALRQQAGELLEQAAFSPDGQRIVTVGKGGRFTEVRVWHIGNGEPLTPTLAHAGRVEAAIFSPDGTTLLTAGTDHTARLWSLVGDQSSVGPLQHSWNRVQEEGIKTGQHEPSSVEVRWLSDDDEITWADFNPQGDRVLTVSANGSARVWDARTGQPVTSKFSRLNQPLYTASFSRDGSRFVTAGGQFYAPNGGRYQFTHRDVSDAREEGMACVWDAQTGEPLVPVLRTNQVPRWAEFSPDGQWLLLRSFRTAWVWEATSNFVSPLPAPLAGPLRTAAFSPDGRLLATCVPFGSPSNPVPARFETRVWNLATSQPATPPLPVAGEVAELKFSPDGQWLVTVVHDPNAWDRPRYSGYAATVQLWDATTGQSISPPLRPQGEPGMPPSHPNEAFPKVLFNAASTRLYVLTTDRIALAWDVANRQSLVFAHLQDPRAVPKALSHDGARWASLRGDHALQVWDAATGEPLTPPLSARIPVQMVRFSPDGMRLLVVGRGGAQVWSLPVEHRPIETVRQHAQLLSGRKFDPAEGMVAVATPALSNLWQTLRTQQPEAFATNPAMVADWHQQAAEAGEREQQWFVAAFHLEHLIRTHPDDDDLRWRLSRARAKAAMRHLQ